MLDDILFGSAMICLFISIPLMLGVRKRPANIWLGLFLFSISWMVSNRFYFRYPEYLFGVFDWPLAGLGPFLYCYARELLGLRNTRRQAWHLLPLALWITVLVSARLLASPAELWAWWKSPPYQTFGLVLQFFTLAYLVAIGFMLRQYRRRVREHYSSINGRDLKWLGALLVTAAVLMSGWIISFAFQIPALCYVLVIAHVLTLFILGWYALWHVGIFLPQNQEAPASPCLAPLLNEGATQDALPEKYSRSGMSDAAQQLIGERLVRRTHTERDYLENDITLTDLAERIGTSPQLLSQYLNHMLGLNFFDYINGLRIEEVKRLICDPAHANAALLDLAMQAGFNSKSTFNAAFKKVTAMTPSVWRKLHVLATEPVN
jgi:AraC-like DNA-binding protein